MVAPIETPPESGGIWIRTNCEVSVVHPVNGRTFTLAELQRYVGGHLQQIRVYTGLLMFIEENGKGRLPFNFAASVLAAGVLMEGDWISGDALLVSPRLLEE